MNLVWETSRKKWLLINQITPDLRFLVAEIRRAKLGPRAYAYDAILYDRTGPVTVRCGQHPQFNRMQHVKTAMRHATHEEAKAWLTVSIRME